MVLLKCVSQDRTAWDLLWSIIHIMEKFLTRKHNINMDYSSSCPWKLLDFDVSLKRYNELIFFVQQVNCKPCQDTILLTRMNLITINANR